MWVLLFTFSREWAALKNWGELHQRYDVNSGGARDDDVGGDASHGPCFDYDECDHDEDHHDHDIVLGAAARENYTAQKRTGGSWEGCEKKQSLFLYICSWLEKKNNVRAHKLASFIAW